ncbi:MAG: 3'-5' exonuclease, partial [Prosthecobacter sp.]
LLEGKTRGHIVREVLQMVFNEGFEVVLRYWVQLLESSGCILDAFSKRRAEDFALAAGLFDEGGSRDVNEFLAFASSYTVSEPDTQHAVQVMTIHKSKGLTFDCVILPDVEGKKLTEVRRGIGVKRDHDRHVEWVLDLPPSELVRADNKLLEFRAEQEADAAYEQLCKFYVALTRAKHANYIIVEPRGKSSSSENFVKLLQLTLGGEDEPAQREFAGVKAEVLFETSTKATNPSWFEIPRQVEPPVEIAKPQPVAAEGRQRPVRRTPSGSETSVVTGKTLFSRGSRFARAYGTLVHALFEQIEWLDDVEDSELAKKWAALSCGDENARAHAEDEVRRSLKSPDIRAMLSRPSPEAICWREKRFEILLKGEWLSGTFDRVMLENNRATILDFKTDKTETDEALASRVEGYRPQLETYREVLACMTGFSHEQITCKLLFTHRCWVITL